MKLKPLHHLTLSLSLLLVACAPQTNLSGTMPASQAVPTSAARTTESVSVRFVTPQRAGFQTQFADISQAAAVSLSLVGDGISGTVTSERVSLVNGEATVTIEGLPIQDGQLRVVTAIAYDSAGNPLQAFVGKGFYTSRRGDSSHTVEISRARWLVGNALELLLASDADTASGIDHAALQANAEAAFGSSDGQFLYDPSLFNPAELATLLETNPLPDSAAILGTRVGPGELLAEVGTFNFGNFGEALTVRINDPNSGQQTIATGSRSPQTMVLDVSPGSWTFEILRADGTLVYSSAVEVDANGVVTSGLIDLGLSNVVTTPVIESISTSATTIGSTLTLTGRGFSLTPNENSVVFGTTPAFVTGTPTATSLEVTVPEGISGDQPVTVEVAGQTSNQANFAVLPTISAVSPALIVSGMADQSVTLTGSGFSPTASGNTVNFGSFTGTISGSPSNTSLTVTVPAVSYGSQPARVTVGSQTSTESGLYFGDLSVNTHTALSQFDPSVASDADGNFVVAWSSSEQDGDNLGVYAQRFNSAGAPQGSEFRVNTYTTGMQNMPSVGMDADGDFVVAWSSTGQDGDSRGVYAQRFNALGARVDNEFKVNSTTLGAQYFPSIGLDGDGDFVVAWVGEDGNYEGIYAQRFNAAGVAQGTEFLVNADNTVGSQSGAALALDADGDFVISWTGPDASQSGIFAQRYNSLGVRQGNEFAVNTFTTGMQMRNTIALDSDGDFVVAWQSNGQDGSGYGVYARRFDAAGNAQGGAFRANTYTTDAQSFPAIALNADGAFTLAWTSRVQDGKQDGVFVRRYDSAGTALAAESQVNVFTMGDQNQPAIARDADGDFVTVWISLENQDGEDGGIFAQIYNADGTRR